MIMTVKDVINKEYEAYQKNDGQECLIVIYDDNEKLASEYIEKCFGVMDIYADFLVNRIEYFSECVEIYIDLKGELQ